MRSTHSCACFRRKFSSSVHCGDLRDCFRRLFKSATSLSSFCDMFRREFLSSKCYAHFCACFRRMNKPGSPLPAVRYIDAIGMKYAQCANPRSFMFGPILIGRNDFHRFDVYKVTAREYARPHLQFAFLTMLTQSVLGTPNRLAAIEGLALGSERHNHFRSDIVQPIDGGKTCVLLTWHTWKLT